MAVIGRGADESGPTLPFGHYRARDGSVSAPVKVDCARPHAACVVGKRGSGKSNTLALLAEGLCEVDGAVPVVVDPMGAFSGLEAAGAMVCEPRVQATAVPPAEWPALVGLDPADSAGSLVWQAADAADTLAGMREALAESDATPDVVRTAGNHLARAAS
ncbi:ATPase, partial [Halobacteriales archaeon QS_9_67_17]